MNLLPALAALAPLLFVIAITTLAIANNIARARIPSAG
jgi:hypothetical protein